jgi:hypothetical protein
MLKRCTICHEEKPVSEFYPRRVRGDTGLTSGCKDCQRKKARQWQIEHPEQHKNTRTQYYNNNFVKVWCIATLNNHKQDGCEVQITSKELWTIAKKTETCAICNTKLDWSPRKGKQQLNSPSLDRKDNQYGVTKDNIQILCNSCNTCKGPRSMAEFIQYSQMIVDKFGGK